MNVKSRASTARMQRTRTTRSDGPRVAASLDSWLARDWSQGILIGSLEEFQQVHVCTRNTLYEIVVVSRCGDVRVRGGRYFPDWTAVRFAGCTAGGSFLKCLSINIGL